METGVLAILNMTRMIILFLDRSSLVYCPKCGFQNLDYGSFCQSCGSPLTSQYSNPQYRQPYYTNTQPQTGMSSGTKIVIVVVVLIAVIGVAVAASAFIFFLPFTTITRVSSPGPVTVTGLYLFIIYPNYTSTTGYFGSSYRFLNTGIIYLQHSETYKTTFTLSLQPGGPSRIIDRIDLAFSGGFTLQNTSPNPPFPVAPGSSQTMTVTMQAPPNDYTGSVTIDLFTH